MSYWTHVAAIARIDCYVDNDDFTPIFGKECLWDSPPEVKEEQREHPERFLPMGSEGSLQMQVWINPHKEHMDRYTVSIFGDLRDHSDPFAIIEWFRNKLKGLPVRQALIEAGEGWDSYTWTWHGEEEEADLGE